MVSSETAVPDGVPGIAQIIATLAALKDYYGAQPEIRAVALRIIGNVGDHNQPAQMARLADFVRRAIVYVCDPLNAEFIQTPDVLLLQIHRRGYAQGDCDDHALLFAALCEAIGIPCQIPAVATPGNPIPDHVIVVAQLDDGPQEFDLIVKNGAAAPVYGEKLFPL